MREQRIPGGSIAVSYNGRVIHRQGNTSFTNENCQVVLFYIILDSPDAVWIIAKLMKIR